MRPRDMISHSTSLARGAALGALAVFAIACGTTEAPGPLEPSGPVARVRFVNVITDNRGPVNAILEGLPFGVNLAYTQSAPITLAAPSTAPYAAVLAGSRTFVVKRTADTTSTVASLPFTSVANQDQTVYAVGGANSTAVTALVTDDVNTAVAAGQGRIRFVQLSPTAGAVDVFITAVGADLAAATPTFTSVAYRGASAYVNVPAGTYQVRAVPAGTAPANRAANVSINLASQVLASGNARTIVAADNTSGGAPLRMFVLTDQ
jgi:hypothetical protein